VASVGARLARGDWDFTADIDRVARPSGWLHTAASAGEVSVAAQLTSRLGTHELRLYRVTSGSSRADGAQLLDTVAVPTKVSRRTRDSYAKWLTRATRQWLRSLPNVVADVDDQIRDAQVVAADARAAAAAVTFDRQAELDAADAELAAINEEIAAMAAAHPASQTSDAAA
jgi:hypothetical protein